MSRWMRNAALVLIVSLTYTLALASDGDPAFARAARLRRGINTSSWFAQSRDYSVERLRAFTTTEDIALISRLGFDHIRLSVDAAPLLAWERTRVAGTPFMTELDRVVDAVLANHLSIIVDIHPESDYKAGLRSGTDSVQHFVMLWRDVARHFSGRDSEHVFFEIMNEPEQNDFYRWQGIQGVVAEAIHQVAPNNTVIAGGAQYSGLPDLLNLEPLADGNVIYTFHDYEPFAFTHQGATWTSPEVQPLRAIPYPSSPEGIDSKLEQEPSLAGQFFLDQYGMARWDADRVERTIEYAARWGKLHRVPVYCGEFGALKYFVKPEMRAQWLHDMRTALEKNNIGWAMWDYQDNFGVVSKQNGVTTPDNDVLDALGLKGISK